MELWIRSQDKRILQKVDNVYLNANYENRRICTNDSRDYESDLGEYKSKERALEILDKIQELLMPIVESTPIIEEDIKLEYTYRHYVSKGSDIEVIQLNTYVYEMPEE